MNDALYELLVSRKPKPYDLPIRILVILLIVAVAVLGMPFIGVLSFMIAVVIAFLAYYFIFPKLNVEYEYILLNTIFRSTRSTTSRRENPSAPLISSLRRSSPRRDPRG